MSRLLSALNWLQFLAWVCMYACENGQQVHLHIGSETNQPASRRQRQSRRCTRWQNPARSTNCANTHASCSKTCRVGKACPSHAQLSLYIYIYIYVSLSIYLSLSISIFISPYVNFSLGYSLWVCALTQRLRCAGLPRQRRSEWTQCPPNRTPVTIITKIMLLKKLVRRWVWLWYVQSFNIKCVVTNASADA